MIWRAAADEPQNSQRSHAIEVEPQDRMVQSHK
jgi:hypothetical protein